MKTTRKISPKQVLSITKVGILALGMSLILCMPTMTMTAHAFGHSNNFGMAYLAEIELKAKEIRAKTENNSIATTVKVNANNTQKSSNDQEETISLEKK
jgi:hypothetical protein